MEKFYNAVCWVGFGILLIFGVTVLLFRVVAIAWLTVWMLLFSSLPWWERILAPAAIIAGMVYIIRRSLGRGIPPNHNFVNEFLSNRDAYPPPTNARTATSHEKRSMFSPKTEDR